METDNVLTIDSIMPELMQIIFGMLPKVYHLIIKLVCKKWNLIVGNLDFIKLNIVEQLKSLVILGDLKYLKYINDNYYKINKSDFDICKIAAESGNLEILKWAKENNCYLDNEVCRSAVQYCHLDILKWIIENNYSWKRCFSLYIVLGRNNSFKNHLEILEWLKENNYQLSSNLYVFSAIRDQLEILKWLKINGYPIRDDVCGFANSNSVVRNWMKENGCTCQYH